MICSEAEAVQPALAVNQLVCQIAADVIFAGCNSDGTFEAKLGDIRDNLVKDFLIADTGIDHCDRINRNELGVTLWSIRQ